MDNQQEEFDSKVYYPIGEVAKMFNTSVSNIRYWENEFDILRPKKNKKGDRFFTRLDLTHLRLIHYLLKEKGYTIEGARKKIHQNPNDALDKLQMVDSLKNIRSFLTSLKDRLDQPVKGEPNQP